MKVMNWEAISAIGEIIGALAVVITLIYLARQIKDNTRVARSATRQSIAETTMSIADDMIGDRELAKVFLKDIQNADLDAAERLQIFARAYKGMRNYENIHYQFLTGMLSENEWLGFRSNLKANFEWASMRAYWDNEKQYYSAPFQKEVVGIIEELSESNEDSFAYVTDEPADSEAPPED